MKSLFLLLSVYSLPRRPGFPHFPQLFHDGPALHSPPDLCLIDHVLDAVNGDGDGGDGQDADEQATVRLGISDTIFEERKNVLNVALYSVTKCFFIVIYVFVV